VTVAASSPQLPFLQLGFGIQGSVYFTSVDADGSRAPANALSFVFVAINTANEVVPTDNTGAKPTIQQRQLLHPEMLGYLDYGTEDRLAIRSEAQGGTGRIDALDLNPLTLTAPSLPVVESGVLAAWRGKSRYFNYAEATADGVVLRSGNVQDSVDTRAVLLPDASTVYPVASDGRVLYFQYQRKGAPSASPGAALPLVRLDLGAAGLDRNPVVRTPEVVVDAMTFDPNLPSGKLGAGVLVPVPGGAFVWRSFNDTTLLPLPELAGAANYDDDACNLYWTTAGSSQLMAMPLPHRPGYAQ
jgi:hypothetical protein